jgi:rhamnulokinase
VGIDAWAMDYGSLDAAGALVELPYCYRDERTRGVMERVLKVVGRNEIYRITGVQFLPFNTLYQLMAQADSRSGWAVAGAGETRRILLVPDLLGYWLTGEQKAELTNASTTQLLDVRSHDWSGALTARLGIPKDLLAPLVRPGDRLGELLPSAVKAAGLMRPVPLLAVASHDTASAVVAVPAQREHFVYISSGTWSLVGVETDRPILTDESLEANFTNELGLDGTVRYLRNVMGLWLLQESMRTWWSQGLALDLPTLLRDAAMSPPLSCVFDPDGADFVRPGNVPARIAAACRATGQPAPRAPAAVVRAILDSLALAHRRAVRAARDLSGKPVEVVHMVGGGSRNELLCQLTADACGLPVVAGPEEAAAIGNALVQARGLGATGGELRDLRRLVRESQTLRRYEPREAERDWRSAEARIEWSYGGGSDL